MMSPAADSADRFSAPNGSAAPPLPRERLSTVMDGEADDAAVDALCRAWRDDADVRATWHAYHLVGDVMRSQELARSPGNDAEFLQRLRDRLADEPVVLAPQPVSRPVPAPRALALRRWMAPGAIAAGFVAVAGVLVVSRMAAPGQPDGASGAPVLAAPQPALDAVRRASVGAGAAALGGATAASSAALPMIRDPEIDRYFRAHREMQGWAGAAVPGGGTRPAEAAVPAR